MGHLAIAMCENRDVSIQQARRGRTLAVSKEDVVNVDVPALVMSVGLVDVDVRGAGERLGEHERALSLVISGLQDTADEGGVAEGRTLLEISDFVAAGQQGVSMAEKYGTCSKCTHTNQNQERLALSTSVLV